MNKRILISIPVTALLLCTLKSPSQACTNFLITRGASVDRSSMITYAADSHVLYGELYYTPAAVHPRGAMREVIDWDSSKRLGQIPQVRRTYAVVGNINEHQVAIGETTFGGRKELHDPQGGVDYGSLMYIALERSRSARQAIGVISRLVDRHGYYSKGESLSISDPKEVWIMEIIGKGPGSKGAVWVARRVPDGYVSAHANQARIRKFPQNGRRDTLYSKDVISFARKKGYYKGPDKDFSFADAYAPLDYGALRICEARVWSMFRRISPGAHKYLPWIQGKEGAEPLPLWIKPDRKLSVHDVMELMRDHFQGTPFDLHKGVGAGPYQLPYRWRPLYWYADPQCTRCKKDKNCKENKVCTKYLNERAISTQQTGFSFVAQSRAGLPSPIGGVLWFGVDDTYSTVYVPMYCGIRQVPHSYAVGTGSFTRFSWDSAFWVFNFVSNYAYSRYRDMIVDIQRVQRRLEGSFLALQPEIEKHALFLYRQAPERARQYLTRYSAKQARRTVERYRGLLTELLLKYLDGNVRDSQGKVTHPGYPPSWYRRVIKERGEHFRVKRIKGELPQQW